MITIKPVIVLGDIHGQLKVFDRLAQVQNEFPEAITVFLGDYVDGNRQGFAVLRRLFAMQQAEPEKTIVLLGNHEELMTTYFRDPTNELWLLNGGKKTLRQAAVDAYGHAGSTTTNRRLVKAEYGKILEWVTNLPTDWAAGHIHVVHAGLDLTLSDPVVHTPQDYRLWAREEYWYGEHWQTDSIFASNPLPFTIVTGHTPTGLISGRFKTTLYPEKRMDELHHPIFTVQYPDEYPRIFIDGGNHGGSTGRRCGNILVLDIDTGHVLAKFEDS